MAFADLEWPYTPFHFPKTATETSWAFLQRPADAAASLLAEFVSPILFSLQPFATDKT
jgi:hypothetical protein